MATINQEAKRCDVCKRFVFCSQKESPRGKEGTKQHKQTNQQANDTLAGCENNDRAQRRLSVLSRSLPSCFSVLFVCL